MRFVHPDQAEREIVSSENVQFTKENQHIYGREPTYDELLRNYKQYNIICKVHRFEVIKQQVHGSTF